MKAHFLLWEEMPLSSVGDWWGTLLKERVMEIGAATAGSVLLDLDVTQRHRGWRGLELVWTKLFNLVDKVQVYPAAVLGRREARLWATACLTVQWKWRQKDPGLKIILSYIVSLKLTWTTLDPVSKNKRKQANRQTNKQKNKTICSKGCCWGCSSEVGRAGGPGLSP